MFRKIFTIILLAITIVKSEQVLKDNSFIYQIYLPNNWTRTVVNESFHQFSDTTATFKSVIAIKKHIFSSTDYSSSLEWTKAHFIAYKLSVAYSVDPFGVVLYSDSSSSCKQGTLRAAEAYSQFFSSDTSIGAWAEYIRFTALGTKGFEIYAIGDTADMKVNLGTYAAILASVVITEPTTKITENFVPVKRELKSYDGLVDPLGRKLNMNFLKQKHNGAIITNRKIKINVK